MARAILRSTDPLLPVLLATRVCPRARSPRLPTRPGCEQQRGERCAGEEHVPPVVFAHLPVSVFSLSFGPARMPRSPQRRHRATGRCSHRPCLRGRWITFLGRRAHDARRPPASPGGAPHRSVRPLSRASSPRRPPSLPRPGSRAHTGSCASFLSFRARRLVRLPPGAGCEQQRGQRGPRQEQMSPVDLRTHPITSFQYCSSIDDEAVSPHRPSVVFPTAPLPGSR